LIFKAIESLGINGVRNITGRRWHRRIPCSRSMKGDSTFPFWTGQKAKGRGQR